MGRYVDENGSGLHYSFPTPQRVEGLSDIVKLASALTTVCAVRADGQLFCWGEDWLGLMRLPSPDGLAPETTTPVAIVDAHDVVDLDMATHHGCLIRRTGEVACWGSDYHGAIGPEPSYVPFGHLQPVRGLPNH
jgi:alpha-tubulin suppressor-like RCC1 family protein